MATAAVAKMTKVEAEAVGIAARLKKQLANIKAKGAKIGENIMLVGLTAGGAAGAGYLAAKFPGQWLKMDKEWWIGGGLVVLGLTGLGGERLSDAALALGGGVIAGRLYATVKEKASA